MSLFAHAEFYRTVYRPTELPPDRGAEVAFAGRSNAGKSSVLNVLVNRQRLAHVSKRPGRTQTINFFSLAGARCLVDLPGYGYAAVPHAQREHWGELVSLYLMNRACLRGLVVICDVRRSLVALDHQLLEWFAATGKPIHVLLTKGDKLSRAQGAAALELATQSLDRSYPGVSVQLFSSLTQNGVPAARKVIAGWMQ
jgi:GTP-binding protein